MKLKEKYVEKYLADKNFYRGFDPVRFEHSDLQDAFIAGWESARLAAIDDYIFKFDPTNQNIRDFLSKVGEEEVSDEV